MNGGSTEWRTPRHALTFCAIVLVVSTTVAVATDAFQAWYVALGASGSALVIPVLFLQLRRTHYRWWRRRR